MSEFAIEVRDLRKAYRSGWFGKRFEALRGVSLTVGRGEIFALLGPNGAGKTTMIKVLLGIVRKTKGTAELLGNPAGNQESRRRVGYLPEQLRLPKHHNARTALGLLGQLSGMPPAEIRRRQDGLLERVGLGDWKKTPLRKFSKGMLQRVGLAQALLHDPELLILDEPTDGLDPVGRREVRVVLEQLKEEGKTVFINSHLLQEVELFCDRVAIMSQGQLRHVGTVDELTERLDVDGNLVTFVLHHSTGAEPLQAAISNTMQSLSIAAADAASPNVIGDNAVELTIPLPDQAAIDQCIDSLRSQQVSIAQLAKKRFTLEDAFLQLIQPAEPPGANL